MRYQIIDNIGRNIIILESESQLKSIMMDKNPGCSEKMDVIFIKKEIKKILKKKYPTIWVILKISEGKIYYFK